MNEFVEMVQSAAKQHRLQLTVEEVEKLARDVPEVLSLFSKLDEYTDTASLATTGKNPSELRKDEVAISKFDAFGNSQSKLIENGYFVAPRIKKQG